MKGHIQPDRLLALALFALTTAPASAYDRPGLYHPSEMLTLNLDMSPEDWTAVKEDTTHSIEVPAMQPGPGLRSGSRAPAVYPNPFHGERP